MDDVSGIKGNAERVVQPLKRVGRRQWVLLYVSATLVFTVLVSWLLGELAIKHGNQFDWGVASATATAVATIALAGGTFVLAVTALEDAGAARELAGATQRLAELTREDMRLRDRPTIMITTYEITSPDPKVRFSVENIGLGPATYITVNVSGFDSTDDAVMTTGPVTIPRTILPNDSHSIVLPFAVRGNVADLTKTELIMVAIDRRGNPSYSLWRERDGAITLAASDFDTNWEPGHSLLERLAQL